MTDERGEKIVTVMADLGVFDPSVDDKQTAPLDCIHRGPAAHQGSSSHGQRPRAMGEIQLGLGLPPAPALI